MTYIINPTDSSRPTLTDPADQGQAELRALKAYLQSVLAGIGIGGLNFFRKNKVLNGDFTFDQRNEGTAVTLSQTAHYIADKWVGYSATGVTATGQRIASTTFGSGSQFIGEIITTVGAAPAVGDKAGFETACIGFDTTDLQWGTINALPISLSFIHKSPVTGLHAVTLRNSAKDRCYVATFLVPAANVAQTIQLPAIPGDQAGNWLGGVNIGIDIFIDGGSGSNFETATPNAWIAGNFTRTAGCAKPQTIAGTQGVSLFQLEQAAAPSLFEFLEYVQHYNMLTFYYEKTFSPGVKPAQNAGDGDSAIQAVQHVGASASDAFFIRFRPKRVTPTLVTYNPFAANIQAQNFTSGTNTTNMAAFSNGVSGNFAFTFTSVGGSVAGQLNSIHVSSAADFF